VVLIEGRELANYMLDLDLGVTPKATYQVKRIDSDYFNDEQAGPLHGGWRRIDEVSRCGKWTQDRDQRRPLTSTAMRFPLAGERVNFPTLASQREPHRTPVALAVP
jgi:hypothetical protein